MRGVGTLLIRWSALSRQARIMATTGLALAIAASLVIGILGHPVRVALFATPLHPEQLAEVEERLAAWHVTFAPTSDNVLVDAARRNDILLKLSLAGVPHPHLDSSDEALSNVGVLTPQAVIDAQTRSGLAGDIEAGLRGIDGIDDARVIVAPAKPADFADEDAHDATASVRLHLRPGAQLSRDVVAGVRAYVAASILGLDPAHVTVLDDLGVALHDDGPRNETDANDLQASLQSALDAALGEGSAIVRVAAEYDGAQSSEHDIRRTPLVSAAIARVTRREEYDGSGKHYRRIEENEDRGSEMQERLSQGQAGDVRRVSTAVFVDEADVAQLARLRELAAATVGYDAARGDTLIVEALPFHHVRNSRPRLLWLVYGLVVTLGPPLLIGIALVGCAKVATPQVCALARSLLDRYSVERAAKATAGFPPSRVHSILAREPVHAAAAIISALPAATATAVLELYPPHEREAIVRRMQRPAPTLLEDPQELLRRHA